MRSSSAPVFTGPGHGGAGQLLLTQRLSSYGSHQLTSLASAPLNVHRPPAGRARASVCATPVDTVPSGALADNPTCGPMPDRRDGAGWSARWSGRNGSGSATPYGSHAGPGTPLDNAGLDSSI